MDGFDGAGEVPKAVEPGRRTPSGDPADDELRTTIEAWSRPSRHGSNRRSPTSSPTGTAGVAGWPRWPSETASSRPRWPPC